MVSIGDQLSSAEAVNYGVPQHSALGPILSTLYINDLPSCFQLSNVTMHADDKVLYFSSSYTFEIEVRLNLELSDLCYICWKKTDLCLT